MFTFKNAKYFIEESFNEHRAFKYSKVLRFVLKLCELKRKMEFEFIIYDLNTMVDDIKRNRHICHKI